MNITSAAQGLRSTRELLEVRRACNMHKNNDSQKILIYI